MSLDHAIEHLLTQSTVCASVQLTSESPSVSDRLQPHAIANNLSREADADECKIFHVSYEGDARRYAEAIRGGSDSSSFQTVERLLAALTALNKICPVPDIADAIEEVQEEYSSREANIQFLRTSCDEGRVDIDQISRAVSAQQVAKQPMAEPAPQTDVKQQQAEDALERDIANQERELENYRRECSEQLQRIEQAQLEIDKRLPTTEAEQPHSSLTLKDIVRDRLHSNNDYAVSFSAARRELINQILSDRWSAVDPEKKLMAKAIQVLQGQATQSVPFQDLRTSLADYAGSLGLQEQESGRVIYKLSIYELVSIDRSGSEAVVRLL